MFYKKSVCLFVCGDVLTHFPLESSLTARVSPLLFNLWLNAGKYKDQSARMPLRLFLFCETWLYEPVVCSLVGESILESKPLAVTQNQSDHLFIANTF